MSDEIAKLTAENIALKEKLGEIEKENSELLEQNAKLLEKNAKLLEKIGTMEAEKCKIEPTHPVVSILSAKEMPEINSTNFDEKMNEKRSQKSVSIPNWLIEVLAWIKRVEMADSKLSISNWTFKQLCWPKLHLNVKPYKVGSLGFRGELNESTGIYQAKLKVYNESKIINIPIAAISPPEYITGFKNIDISFFDGLIKKFIECILPKLNGIRLEIGYINIPFWQLMKHFDQIRCLFEMLAKEASSISGSDGNFFYFLRDNPNAFGLIENVQEIGDVKLKESDIDLLLNWLNKSRPDRKPKILEFYSTKEARSIFIDRIKEQFIFSTQPANFIIPFVRGLDYPNLNVENEKTGEVLALCPNPKEGEMIKQFLVRLQKGQEQLGPAVLMEQWKQINKLPYFFVDLSSRIGEF